MNDYLKRYFKKSKRFLEELFLFHIFKQNRQELLDSVNTLYTFSLTLLFISIIITLVAAVTGHLPVTVELRTIFRILNNYCIYAFFFFLLASLILVVIKTNAFEKHQANLLWGSFIFDLVGIVLIVIFLMYLVFGER